MRANGVRFFSALSASGPGNARTAVKPVSFPFRTQLAPVCYSLHQIKKVVEEFPANKFCLFIASRSDGEWGHSVSRKALNQVLPNLIYLPVHVPPGDNDLLGQIYQMVRANPAIVAVNHTMPHKSNPVMMKEFPSRVGNADFLLKSASGKVELYNLNGPAFVNWYDAAVAPSSGQLTHRNIVLFGAGGAGAAIARSLAEKPVGRLAIIEPQDKQALCRELARTISEVACCHDAQEIQWPLNEGHLDVFNCSGIDLASVMLFLAEHEFEGNNFIDIRTTPYGVESFLQRARNLNWRAFNGDGMNAYNDYTLMQLIAGVIEETMLAFEVFSGICAAAMQ